MSILSVKHYKPFRNLVIQNKKKFSLLVLLLSIEVVVITASVVSTIPLVDFILDPELISPNKLTSKILNYLTLLNLKASLALFLFIFIFSNVVKGLISLIVFDQITSIQNFVETKYTKNLLLKILHSNWKFFSNKDTGMMINTSTKIINDISTGFSQTALHLSLLFKLLIYTIIPILLDWKIFLTTVFFVIICSLPLKFLNSFADIWAKSAIKNNSIFFQNLSETFNAVKLVFGYNLQSFSTNRIVNPLKEYLKFQKKKIVAENFIITSIQPLMLICVSAIFVIFYNNTSDLSKLGAIFWSLVSSFPIISQIFRGNFNLLSLAPSISHYEKFYSEARALSTSNSNATCDKEIINSLKNKIEFNNINFYYTPENQILKNCSFKIDKNDFVLLVGESGSGKSTLIDILMGFQKPIEGGVFVDGKNLEKININSYRNIVGYVPQEPFLFNTSIIENIKLAKNNLQLEEIKDVLKITNCNEFISKFKYGLDTIVGEKGTNLSGGQRQRLALARALVRNPEILILDEPTNSLDAHSSNLIYSTLKNISKKMTIILISHQTLNDANFDKIFYLRNKKFETK